MRVVDGTEERAVFELRAGVVWLEPEEDRDGGDEVGELADTDAQLTGSPDLPRLFLLEEEYRKAILTAQLSWLRDVIDDLQTGRLTWNEQWLAQLFAAFHPDGPDRVPNSDLGGL